MDDLDKQRWLALSPLLDELLDLETAARQQRLDELQAQDPDTAAQLQRLLAARDLLAEGPARDTAFWTSAEPQSLDKVLPLLWGRADRVLPLPL